MHSAQKPVALRPGDYVRVLSLASPVQEELLRAGVNELSALGYKPQADMQAALGHESFFAGPREMRVNQLRAALRDPAARAIFCARGGYGTNYLLECLAEVPKAPKILLGASDLTSLQIFLWQKFGWVTFYGPMVATNFNRGAGAAHGYDRESLLKALAHTQGGWSIDLQGEPLVAGQAEGVVLGGCLTLIEMSLGTPWELDTTGAILALEDRAMKPYQVDRSLMHLKQAGKLKNVAGVILGDFPQCEGPADGETVQDVARRILAPLGMAVIWGAPIGHTDRAMLTLPLGVRAALSSEGVATLKILEPACAP
jgi:muramoyltetrapeptide carboxypeptidase